MANRMMSRLRPLFASSARIAVGARVAQVSNRGMSGQGAQSGPSAGLMATACVALTGISAYMIVEEGGFFPVQKSASSAACDEKEATSTGSPSPVASTATSIDTVTDDKDATIISTPSAADAAAQAEADDSQPAGPVEVPYVLIGGGTASYFAVKGILSEDPNAKILIVAAEDSSPYMRPPLSKELWFREGDASEDDLTFTDWGGRKRNLQFEKDQFYCTLEELATKEKGVALLKGVQATDLDVDAKLVSLDNGQQINYNKLLLATGGKPKSFKAIDGLPANVRDKVTIFRNTADFHRLQKSCNGAKSVAVVGGGFLGSELAVAVAQKFKNTDIIVNQVFPEEGNMGHILPKYLSHWTTEKVRAQGVNVVSGELVSNAYGVNGSIILELQSGSKITADHVLVAVGIEPNVELGVKAKLETDPKLGGILVNSELEACSDVWVAGDVCSFYDRSLGRRRVEHHDHAAVSGRLAGRNMAGARTAYKHQSMFWSDLGPEVGYEAVGLIDADLPTVGVWAKASKADTPKAAVEQGQVDRAGMDSGDAVPAPVAATKGEDEFGKGVIFYLQDKRVVGVVTWNIFGKMPVARRVIREAKQYDDLSELKSSIKLHENDH